MNKRSNTTNKKLLIASLGAFFYSALFSAPVYGLSSIQEGALAAHSASQPINLFGAAGIFTVVSNMMLFIVGALSVVMLIIGGLRYVVSGGNAATVTSAKNTILYAIIGLIIAVMAYAAINFILSVLVSGDSSSILAA